MANNKDQFCLDINAFKQLPGHVYTMDKEDRLRDCNLSQALDLGYSSSEEVIGKTAYELFPKEEADKIARINEQVMREERTITAYEPAQAANGKTIYYLSHKSPLYDSSGEIVGVIGNTLDVTEDVVANQKVLRDKQQAEMTLHKIISLLPGHVYWKDKNGVIQGCNDNQARSVGLTCAKDMVGKTAFDTLTREQALEIVANDELVMQSRKTITKEELSNTGSGAEACYLSSKAPLIDDAGDVVGLVGMSFDITARKALERAELDVKKHEEANKLKSAFLYDLQHELRTPLSGLCMGSHIANSDKYDQETRKEMLEVIEPSANLLMRFLDEMLDALEVFGQGISTAQRKFDLPALIENLIALEAPVEKLKPIKLLFDVEENVPRYIHCAYFALRKVIFGLINNAIKFTSQGSVEVRLSDATSVAMQEGRQRILRLEVVDSGIGIPQEKQKEIFELFTRVHPANKELYKGAGVGLFLVKSALDILEGDIDLHSELDRGTVVRVDFPCSIPLVSDTIDSNFFDSRKHASALGEQ